MATSIVARIEGDDYQARFFWYQVCRLFQPYTHVMSVRYEWDEVKGFDDVVVVYDPPICDDCGGVVNADYYQLKFHVSQDGVVSTSALTDPSFINSESTSFLQKLKNGFLYMKQQDIQSRFYLVTPWYIEKTDPLARLVNNDAGQFRLDRLFDGRGPKSEMGKIRTSWSLHLNVEESELGEILKILRIWANWGTLDQLKERLNDKLLNAGLTPVDNGSSINPYDDLIRKLFRAGKTSFTLDEIKEICRREGLWVGKESTDEEPIILGIRSFINRTEYMEDETQYMLDLVPYFDERKIVHQSSWNDQILPLLDKFISEHTVPTKRVIFHLDTHTSIALASGYNLHSKSGVGVTVVQKTLSGRELWSPQIERNSQEYPGWSISETIIDDHEMDIVMGISITHDLRDDVENYVSSNIKPGKILFFTVQPNPSSTSIINDIHSLQLIQGLIREIRKHRIVGRRVIHLFIAGPNGFSFMLGQHCHGLGTILTYEYNFESGEMGQYEPAITLS